MSRLFKNSSALLLSLALVLLLAVLPACSPAPRAPASDGRVTLVFKHAKHPRYAFLTRLLSRFEAENPHIRIREEILPSSTDEQHQFYVVNLAAGAADFDIIDMDVIWVPEFARAGWLSDLTPHIPASDLAPLFPAALRADVLDDRLYGIPWFVDAGVLYYRRDLLQKHSASVPQTFPELVSTAQRILAAENNPRLNGYVWQGAQYEGLVCAALEVIRANGGDVLTPDGRPSLTSPPTLEALAFLSDLIRRHHVTPPLVTTLNEEASRHIFQSGRAIFMRNWPYAWRLLNEPGSPVAGNVGITLVPHFPGGKSAPTLGGFHLGINSRSPFQKEAVTFLRFMLRYDVQREILLSVGVLPAHTAVYRDPKVLKQLPVLRDLLPALENVQPRPVTPYYLMISQILQPELSGIVAGLYTPEQAMRNAQRQISHLLAPSQSGNPTPAEPHP